MTKREYKAVLRSVIRANYWLLNPQFRMLVAFGNEDFDICGREWEEKPNEIGEFQAVMTDEKQVYMCSNFAPVWKYRRLFVDKLAALFAVCDNDCEESYAEHSILVKYAHAIGRVKYSDLVEEYTPERFATEEERAAFELFAYCLHGIIIDLYWEYGVYLSEYIQPRRTA